MAHGGPGNSSQSLRRFCRSLTPFSEHIFSERVQREQPGSECEDDQSRQPVHKGICFNELIRIAYDAAKCLRVGSQIGYRHRDKNHKRDRTRKKANYQQKASKTFKGSNKASIQTGKRNTKTCEE